MDLSRFKSFTRRPSVIITALAILAILGFVGVNHLVSRFREQQKALARRMFRRAQTEVAAGNPALAVESFRVALAYDRSNDQYQLSLARALRDTGATDEARSYLVSLWERKPEDSTINLALARLAARNHSVEEAVRYYHNAMYGAWPSDADSKRRDAQFELIEFLLRSNALPQAQAELITMSPMLASDAGYHLRLGKLFFQSQDYEHALAQFQQVLRLRHEDFTALAGAGQAAFQIGRYRTAQGYLSLAVKTNSDDAASHQLLMQSNLLLQTDPYVRRISGAERERRVRKAFEQAGERLESCMTKKGAAPTPSPANGDLASLKSRWLELKPKLAPRRRLEMELNDAAMDLAFQIEQATATQCGPPAGLDQALLVLSQDREGAER